VSIAPALLSPDGGGERLRLDIVRVLRHALDISGCSGCFTFDVVDTFTEAAAGGRYTEAVVRAPFDRSDQSSPGILRHFTAAEAFTLD
jgi:hypothetical protein